jgi:hypothetical protein
MMCPDCGFTLSNAGAESQGDGDMYDVWYCNTCHCRKYHEHASYCECIECASRFFGKHGDGKYLQRVHDEPDPCFGEPY